MGQKKIGEEAMFARMRGVLLQDRGIVAQRLGDQLRGRIVDVLRDYVDADPEYAEIRVERQTVNGIDAEMALVVYVPIRGIKDGV